MLRMNVKGVGVDCEQASRFENMDSKLMEKIFTKNEIDYCSRKANPSQHLAARFAAKEAVIKCFGSMGCRIFMNRIEILNRKNGSPYVRMLDKNLSTHGVKISLSHSGGMAIAFAAVAWGGKNG